MSINSTAKKIRMVVIRYELVKVKVHFNYTVPKGNNKTEWRLFEVTAGFLLQPSYNK
jgi:hypothetical protein